MIGSGGPEILWPVEKLRRHRPSYHPSVVVQKFLFIFAAVSPRELLNQNHTRIMGF
jgi:hypothetical protein